MSRKSPRTRRSVWICEDAVRSKSALRVDREKGVIYGVKILGLESVNDRVYQLEALRQARDLYEGVGVFVNHPDKPNDPREFDARIGRLVNITFTTDGLYGDLEVLKAHPNASVLMEAAERMPEQIGLSHNAKCTGPVVDGIWTIEKIDHVRSVDLVTEPATTDGLFEQREGKMPIKIKTLFESAWKTYKLKCKKRPKLAAKMKAILEDDEMGVMDDDADGVDAEPPDADDALRQGFESSCVAVIQKALDGDIEPKDALSKLKDMMTAHAKLSDGDDEESEDLEEEDEEPTDDNKDGKKGGSKDAGDKMTEEQTRLRMLERKDKARDLCDEAGIVCDKVLMEALMHLPDTAAQKRFIEREKKGAKRNGPRSGAPGTSGDNGQRVSSDAPESIMAALLG